MNRQEESPLRRKKRGEAKLKESAARDEARPHSRLMSLAQAWFHAGSSSVVLKK